MKNKLKEMREMKGFSKWKLYQETGVSYSHIGLVEEYKCGVSFEKALRLADALGCELEELFPEFRKDVARAMR